MGSIDLIEHSKITEKLGSRAASAHKEEPTVQTFDQFFNRATKQAGVMRQLVDQEHFMLLQQAYCGYNKVKDKKQNPELQEALRHLS